MRYALPMFDSILGNALYLLAIINPISKICVLTVFSENASGGEIKRVVTRSNLIALALLVSLMIAGNFILRTVFKVELYSLRISGGIVLFYMGFNALTKGLFFDLGTKNKFSEISIVPLACPLIAGPGTIAATLSLSAELGLTSVFCSVILAIGANMGLMLLSNNISALLNKHNILGALVRVTGLIVATLAIQMVLSGIAEWSAAAFPKAP